MTIRKIFWIPALISILALVGYGLAKNASVRAQEATTTEEEEHEEIKGVEKLYENLLQRLEKTELKAEKVKMSLSITPQGKVTMVNANLEKIDGTNLDVKLFGMVFKVDASKAKIIGGGTATTSDMKVGDKLLIKGEMDEVAGVIKAGRIQDRSLHIQAISNLQARIQELLKLIEELRAKLKIQQWED